MIEIIGGLIAALLGAVAYVFKVQRDAARQDAEEKRKEADQAKEIAEVKQNQTEELIRAAEQRERIDDKADEIVKRPERDFFQ